MLRFVGRRLVFLILTVVLASAVIFVVTQVLPGDVTVMVLGRFSTEEARDKLREELGMDKPLLEQYATWLADFFRGDWGTSPSTSNADIRELTLTRLRNSAVLALAAMLMYIPLGILVGVLTALKRDSWFDHVMSIGSLSFIGLPEFVTAVVLISIFALQLNWLPAQSAIDPRAGPLNAIPQLILPAITVSLASLAYIIRMTRASAVEVLRTDYVRTARLKGLSTWTVLLSHVLRNALLPTITVIAMGIAWLIGGLIITEAVFSYPGLGRLLLFAIQRRDVPLIQAISMVMVMTVVLSNLGADLLYAYLNPRIRYT